jgi:hypothetical protein
VAALPLLLADDNTKKADTKPAIKDEVKKDDAKKKDDPEFKKSGKTTKKEADPEKKAEKKEKLVWGATFQGKVKNMDANSQKNFSIEVQIPVPNPEGQQALLRSQASWSQRQAQILTNRNLNAAQRQQQLTQLNIDIQRAMPGLQAGLVKLQPKEVPVRASDNPAMRVRTIAPVPDYDEKGNIKKLTKKELQELKGPENLPGYTAEFEALHAGQFVQVYLAKNQPNPVPKAGAKAPPLKLDDDANLGDPNRLEVVMIVIMAEPKDR